MKAGLCRPSFQPIGETAVSPRPCQSEHTHTHTHIHTHTPTHTHTNTHIHRGIQGENIIKIKGCLLSAVVITDQENCCLSAALSKRTHTHAHIRTYRLTYEQNVVDVSQK